jgi:hypothetical protein
MGRLVHRIVVLSALLSLVACLAFGFTIGCSASTVAAADAAAADGAPRGVSTLDDAIAAPGDGSSAAGDGGPDDGPFAIDGALTPISWDGRAPLSHRDAAVACPRVPAADSGFFCPDSSSPLPGNPCVEDSDCTASPNGLCLCAQDLVPPDSGNGPGTLYNETYCSYDECFVDSDCGRRVPCDCRTFYGGTPNMCLPASNCAVDSDCPPPGFCSPSSVPDQAPYIGFFCHTPNDTCIDAVDCPLPNSTNVRVCSFDATSGTWRCFEEPTRL